MIPLAGNAQRESNEEALSAFLGLSRSLIG
jgi:hypothetical protein